MDSKNPYVKSDRKLYDDNSYNMGSMSMTTTVFDSLLRGNAGGKAPDLRKVFIENYGVQMELPAYYYLDAKFVPHQQNMIVVLAWHIIPSSASAKIFSKFIGDKEVYENFYDEVYQRYGNKVVLQLLKADGQRGFNVIKDIQMQATPNVLMQFSLNGSFFGIYSIQHKILNVYDSKSILKCFYELEQGNSFFKVDLSQIFETEVPKQIVFGCRHQYMALFSNSRVAIISLVDDFAHNYSAGEVVQVYALDIEKFESISDLNLSIKSIKDGDGRRRKSKSSVSLPPYSCIVACKLLNFTNIHIFDISEQQNTTRSISYADSKNDFVVKIGSSLNTVVFSNKVENFLLIG